VNETERLIAARQGDDKVTHRIRNPHDPDVRYGIKGNGSLTWTGFKLHVTETIDAPRFITNVTLTAAAARDVGDLAGIEGQLAERDLIPAKHYVDQGYMSGENIARSFDRGIDLRGCIGPDTQGKPPGFRLEDFHIDMDQRQAICPAGPRHQRSTFDEPAIEG
jgi:transposase